MAAVTLHLDGSNHLTGASGVVIGNNVYDVIVQVTDGGNRVTPPRGQSAECLDQAAGGADDQRARQEREREEKPAPRVLDDAVCTPLPPQNL